MIEDRNLKPAVRQIDHLYVALADAANAFNFLSEVLQLPPAWPYLEYGLFASGGVCLGNVNLEVLQARDVPRQRAQHPARISGVAFEPTGEIEDAIAALDMRGIEHTTPMPFIAPGQTRPVWTNVGVDMTEETFLCKYHFDVTARRQALAAELAQRRGGPMGIVRVDEVVFGARDLDMSAARWSQMLGTSGQDLLWTVGGGPAIRLVQGESDCVEHLVVRVGSLNDAIAIASKLGIGIAATSDGAKASIESLGGLVFHLRA